MARPAPWQLDVNNYPFLVDVPPRYGDLDTMGHVNNVAIASIFETARIAFHHKLGTHPREQGVRWLVAAVNMAFVDEMHLGHMITVGCGFGPLGNSSWRILAAAFQGGQCCATNETVMVVHGPRGRRQITEAQRLEMAPWQVHRAEEIA